MPNDSNKMIRIGFVGYANNYWLGGVNYLLNLLYAIKTLNDPEIHITVFFGKKVDSKIVKEFEPYVDNIIKTKVFDKGILQRLTSKICRKIFKRPEQINRLFKKNRIDILSHSNITGKGLFCKTISWIPDFQHIHLPNMFIKKELKSRNKYFRRLGKESDCIILSSFDAFKDFGNFAPEYLNKAKVLHFVSQPKRSNQKELNIEDLIRKYDINEKYFYLPGQFWKHKNHITVFKAINILKNKYQDILLVCSGNMDDYRNKDHIKYLENYIEKSNLTKNIRLLGIIDYDDVIDLMRNSISIINPSFFEGWSSTVEESKSLDHRVVLSDIAVHEEQDPKKGMFFDKNNPEELAKILTRVWNENTQKNNAPDKRDRNKVLALRTKEFAQGYKKILLEVIKQDK